MASFCAQCSIDIWGHDYKDYAGQSTEEDTKNRMYTQALCEGCGGTLVDHRGFCVHPNCMLNHGILVEECELPKGDLLEAKPFEYRDSPIDYQFGDDGLPIGVILEESETLDGKIARTIRKEDGTEVVMLFDPPSVMVDETPGCTIEEVFDQMFGKPEPVGKDWLEGLSDEQVEKIRTGNLDADGPNKSEIWDDKAGGAGSHRGNY